MSDLDENGWLIAPLAPLPVTRGYSLLAPEPSSALGAERLRHQAARFFRLDLTLITPKRYPGGGYPRVDRATFRVTRGSEARELDVITMPLDDAPDVRREAARVAAHIGAGLDVLVARAVRLWQVPASVGDAFPLALTTVLASVLLAPVLPPTADVVFGVKTARLRLEALGWRT